MFNSNFSKRLIAYLRSPKKYMVNVTLTAERHRLHFHDVQVISYSKAEAIKKAESLCRESISVTAYGIKSFGRVKSFRP